MPGPNSQPSFASTLRDGFADLPGNLALGFLAEALKKAIENPGLSWSAAVAAVTGSVLNPLAAAGILGLGIAMKLNELRNSEEKARQVERELRAQAAQHQTMYDILVGLENRSITVGLDELALLDIREIIDQAFNKQSDKLNNTLEGAFEKQQIELMNIRIFEQSTNTIVRENREVLSKIMKHLKIDQPLVTELHTQVRTEVESGYAEQFTSGDELAKSVDLAAQAMIEVADTPGIEDSLLEKGGQAIIDALLDKQAASEQHTIETHRQIAEWAYLIGNIEQAEESSKLILGHLPEDLDAINRLGHIYEIRGEWSAAEEQYQRVLQLSKENTPWRAAALGNLGLIARNRDKLDEAERMLSESLSINQQLGLLNGQAEQLLNLGVVARLRDDLDVAERLYKQALEIDRQLENRKGQAVALGNLGVVAFLREDLDQAERLYQDALVINREINRLVGQAIQLGNLGEIALKRGDLDQAEGMYRDALEINREVGRVEGQANQLSNLATVAKQRQDYDQARGYWTMSLHLFDKLGIQNKVSEIQGWLDGLPK